MSFINCQLRDAVELAYGKSLPERNRKEGTVPVYGSGGIGGYHSVPLVEGPGVIVGRKGTVGSVYFEKNDFFPIDTVYFVRPYIEKISLEYSYYLLKNLPLASLNSDAAVPGLNRDRAYSLPIRLPSLDQQNRIVEFLRQHDDLIENNRRRIQLLEESARLLYQEWFVHLRFPGHEKVKMIDGVPEGWEPTLVPDVIDVNPRTPVEKGKEIWYVPMSSLSETSMTANTADFERRTKHTNVKFKKNDVLLARITPCLENGKTGYAYFLAEDEVACGSTEFIVLRGNRVPSEFVYCLARSYPFRENAIKSMTGSSGRQRVQNSCFEKYTVPLPPKSILDEFVQVVQNNFDQIRNLMAQNARLAKARDLLLPKLMSGELTV